MKKKEATKVHADRSFYSEARGYVDGEFKVFHIQGRPSEDIPLHFHNFRKVLILQKGTIDYIIEGVYYHLRPGDVVLVDKGELHRPVFRDDKEYERTILYLSDAFFESMGADGAYLAGCFDDKSELRRHVMHGVRTVRELVDACVDEMADGANASSGRPLFLQKIRVMEFLIRLNDLYFTYEQEGKPLGGTSINANVLGAMDYISAHLAGDLSVEQIAGCVHLSRYHLMHLFKAETGYTINEFITDKRLILAERLMREGTSLTEVCYASGFTSYSSFYRAYRKKYAKSPRGGK